MKKKFGAFGARQFSLGTLVGGRPGTTIFQNPGGGGRGGGAGGGRIQGPGPAAPPGVLCVHILQRVGGPGEPRALLTLPPLANYNVVAETPEHHKWAAPNLLRRCQRNVLCCVGSTKSIQALANNRKCGADVGGFSQDRSLLINELQPSLGQQSPFLAL